MQNNDSKVNVLPGGKAPIYPSNIMIRFDEKNALKKSEDVIEDTAVNITIMKSRPKKLVNRREVCILISKIDPDRINNVKIVGEYVGDKSLKDISNFCQLRNQYDFYDDISMCYNCGTIVKFDKVTKMLISCPKCKRTLFYNREGSDCNKNYMIFLNTTAITVERIKELYNKVNPCGGSVTQYFMDDMQYITDDVNNLLSFLQQSISKNPNTKKYVCLTAKEDCLIDILNSEIFRDKIQSTVYQRSDKSDCFIIAKVLN